MQKELRPSYEEKGLVSVNMTFPSKIIPSLRKGTQIFKENTIFGTTFITQNYINVNPVFLLAKHQHASPSLMHIIS